MYGLMAIATNLELFISALSKKRSKTRLAIRWNNVRLVG